MTTRRIAFARRCGSCPILPRHHGLGMAIADQLKLDEAVAMLPARRRCKPDFADAHNNLGNACAAREAR